MWAWPLPELAIWRYFHTPSSSAQRNIVAEASSTALVSSPRTKIRIIGADGRVSAWRTGASEPAECVPEDLLQAPRLQRPPGAEQDRGPAPGLAHLVLGHAGVALQGRAEHVRVHGDAARLHERVVAPPMDVGDTPVGGTTRARSVHNRHLIRDLVTDQRLYGVEEIGDVDLVRGELRRDRAPVRVERIDAHEVIRDVHAALLEAADHRDARLRGPPEVCDRRLPQAGGALLAQPLRRPRQAPQMLSELPEHVFDVTPARGLVTKPST